MMPVPPECSTALCALRDYVDARFRALENAIELRAETHERALDIAHRGLEKRLEGMNEFRAQLRDQTATLLPRAEYELMHEKLCAEVRELRDFRIVVESKASQKAVTFATGLAVLASILALCSFGLALVDFMLRKGP